MRGLRRIAIPGMLWLTAVTCLPAAAHAVDQAVLDAEQARVEVIADISPTVVAIFAKGGQGGGSGVLISADGYALTNFHVTSGAGDFLKCGLADGVLYDAVIVGIDPTGDVALIKLFGREDFPAARLGDSDALEVGDWAIAMGNPFLLATDFQPTLTYGIVSGIHRYQYPAGTILEYTDCIQVDASINPGNSGGPLFNAQGQLVGINGRGSFEKRGRVNSGAGYAISINQIKHFMDQLRSGRVVDHATLGASVAARDDGAVVVTNILEQSEAFRRGLRIDDELVSFAGRSIGSVNQFKNVLGIYPSGWMLPIVYRRDGQKQEILVRMRNLHSRSELVAMSAKKPAPPQPRRPGGKPPEPPAPGHPPVPAAESKTPAHLAKFFVEKPGYANYFFNQLEQDRVLKGLLTVGNFSAEQGTWKIAGTLDKETPVELTLAESGAGMVLDGGRNSFVQPFGTDGDFADEPPGTGGLLLALHHFRLLASRGPKAFSDFQYFGSEPLDGIGERVDVLLAELTGAVSSWYFSRDTGILVGFDLRRAEDVDACEIRIAAWKQFSNHRLPERIDVRHAGKTYPPLHFQSYRFNPASREAVPPAQKPAAAGSGKPGPTRTDTKAGDSDK